MSRWGVPLAVGALVLLAHGLASPSGEPWKNNDETRHVMTGVFVADALQDFPTSVRDPIGYAERYYTQYPALGLLVWPPLFYLVEGIGMAIFGPSYLVARLVLSGFVVWAFLECLAYFRRTVGAGEWATVALALFGITPLIFEFSRYVLLEMPTLALVMASVNRFEAYLAGGKGRTAVWACLFAAGAALTRFDGVVLAPYFLIRLGVERRWHVLLNRPVLIGILLALGLTVPYYLFTMREYAAGLNAAATSGTASHSTGFLAADNFWLYPAYTFRQVGRFTTLAAVVGLWFVRWRGAAGALPALVLATYVTFVPLAEPEPRHAIYWVPALCGLAAYGLRWLTEQRGRKLGTLATGLTVFATGYQTTWEEGWYVIGYRAAADYVATHRTTDRPVLFDGVLTGGFIYQVRLADPTRSLSVIRGDKLLYAVLSDVHAKYVEFAGSDEEILERIHAADPEFIVVEEPQMFEQDTPAAHRLRVVLLSDPERFPLVAYSGFGTNHYVFERGRLLIYRKQDRNANPSAPGPVPVLGLGRGVGGG